MSAVQEPSGAVSYMEVNAMVRLGQRQELEAYLRQFVKELDVVAAKDMTLAKSRLIALVTALVTSTLEIGAPQGTESRIADVAEKAIGATTREDLLALAEYYLGHMIVCASPNANRYSAQIIERCKSTIATDYGQNLTDELMAERANLSRSHFRFLFKEVTGMPFKRYLSEVRLNAARSLILESQLSIKEICIAVGYQDTSSFYRAYRGFHGVPPTAHRVASV